MRARTAVTLTLTALVAAGIAFMLRSGGGSRGEPIRVEGARLVVENQTAQAWSGVSVTINAYYRVRTPSINPGGRLETPLGNLETGLGQRFNTSRETVTRVEVRATDSSGKPVAIDWDANK
jgi:hypothetical protein